MFTKKLQFAKKKFALYFTNVENGAPRPPARRRKNEQNVNFLFTFCSQLYSIQLWAFYLFCNLIVCKLSCFQLNG